MLHLRSYVTAHLKMLFGVITIFNSSEVEVSSFIMKMRPHTRFNPSQIHVNLLIR